MKYFFILLMIFIFNSSLQIHAQGTKADYERSLQLGSHFANKVFNDKLDPHFYAEGSKFWYDRQLPNQEHEFISVVPQEKKKSALFDHAALASELNQQTKSDFVAGKLPFRELMIDPQGIIFKYQNKDWLWDDITKKLTVKNDPSKTQPADDNRSQAKRLEDRFRNQFNKNNPRSRSNPKSPDQKWEAYIQDHNVFLKNLENGETDQLSNNGTKADAYQAEFYWSPDSLRLIVPRESKGDVHTVYMVESSPKDQVQPKLLSHQYLKPGDKIPQKKPHLFNLESQREIKLDDKLFDNPWSTDSYQWSSDSNYFYFYYNQRGHQISRVLRTNADTGEVAAVVDEVSPTFIDYAYKKYFKYLDQTNEILWASERDGWNHLYLYDALTGQVKNQITTGNWVLRDVIALDAEKRQLWFTLSGYDSKQDPYHLHYARINFDGTGLTLLTQGDGTHKALLSPDNKYLINTYSRVDSAPVHEVRSLDNGELLLTLETTDLAPLIAAGWQTPERFVAKGRDDATEIHGIIIKPTNFDPTKKYPVIEHIYAGPHSAFVPKAFTANMGMMKMAELGFIVVQIDGMGTNHRGKKFHDVCWKNLCDSGFADRIKWIKAAAKDRPFMDLNRVGIYGGSAGGQSSTRAMLAHGDFYKVAVSDCGCHDNRMDKIWWNELWMSWPIGDHYKEQSNVTQAHKLQGKLLLIVGEVDHNVDPASTMQVVNALIKADKDFDLLIIPGSDHGAAESPYGQRRRMDFFVRHLWGVEPRNQ